MIDASDEPRYKKASNNIERARFFCVRLKQKQVFMTRQALNDLFKNWFLGALLSVSAHVIVSSS